MDQSRTPRLDNWKLLSYLRDDLFLEQSEKLLAILVALHRNAITFDCSPSNLRLAKQFKRTDRTVRTILQSLRKKSILFWVRNSEKRNQYYFRMDFGVALKMSKQDGCKANRDLILKANRWCHADSNRK